MTQRYTTTDRCSPSRWERLGWRYWPFQLDGRALGVVVLVAALVRFLGSAVPITFTADSMAYQISAVALAQGVWPHFTLAHSPEYGQFVAPGLLVGGWPDFFIERTPGFPLLLLALVGVLRLMGSGMESGSVYAALLLVQAGMGIGLAAMLADISFRWLKNRKLAVLTGGLAAISPNLLAAEHMILTETSYAFVLGGLLWLLIRGWPAWFRQHTGFFLGLGLLAAALVWIRPIGVVVPLCLMLFFWRARVPVARIMLVLAPVGVAIAIWVGFQVTVHQFWGLTAGSGMNQLYKTIDALDPHGRLHAEFRQELMASMRQLPPFLSYAAVNTVHTKHLQREQEKPPSQRRPMWQIYREDDRMARALSLETILNNPGTYLAVTVREAYRQLIEPADWDPFHGFACALLLLGSVGALRLWVHQPRGSVARFWVLCVVAHLALTVLLTLAHPRYRIPLDVMMIPLAVYGATCWRRTLKLRTGGASSGGDGL